jgi:uncharacterized protein (TIGR02722 family)
MVHTNNNHGIFLGLLLLSLTLAGCNTTSMHGKNSTQTTPVTTVTPKPKPATPVKNKPVDLSPLAAKSAESVATKTSALHMDKKFRLYVDRLRNSTGRTINMEKLTTVFYDKLAGTNQFNMVEPSSTGKYQESLEYVQSSGALNPSVAVQVGKQTGADLMVYGTVSYSTKRHLYYLVTHLMDLKSGELLIRDSQSLRRR